MARRMVRRRRPPRIRDFHRPNGAAASTTVRRAEVWAFQGSPARAGSCWISLSGGADVVEAKRHSSLGALGGIRPQDRQQFIGLCPVLAERGSPQLARHDHRHAIVDSGAKLVRRCRYGPWTFALCRRAARSFRRSHSSARPAVGHRRRRSRKAVCPPQSSSTRKRRPPARCSARASRKPAWWPHLGHRLMHRAPILMSFAHPKPVTGT
jgi:hypothetical protein